MGIMYEDHYEYIICGAGCAGLSLAIRFAAEEYRHLRILLLDRDAKMTDDRTWSFWYQGTHRYDDIVHHRWSHISVRDDERSLERLPLAPYEYQSIRGIDFYDYCREKLSSAQHITWVQAEVLKVTENESTVSVNTSQGTFNGDYVFDSIVRSFPTDGLFTWQHFRGWIIETDTPSFDSETATFMDFRTLQCEETRFLYVLPYGENRALVEATIFGAELYEDSVYDEMIRSYIAQHLGIAQYRITDTEQGKIPMTTSSMTSVNSPRIIPIGTANGSVKPSSGYAFIRIQEECDELIEFISHGSLRAVRTSPKYRAYDKTLLRVMLSGYESGASVFTRLFARNKIERIMAFLDERTSIWQEIKIFSTLPFFSFLRAFIIENVSVKKR